MSDLSMNSSSKVELLVSSISKNAARSLVYSMFDSMYIDDDDLNGKIEIKATPKDKKLAEKCVISFKSRKYAEEFCDLCANQSQTDGNILSAKILEGLASNEEGEFSDCESSVSSSIKVISERGDKSYIDVGLEFKNQAKLASLVNSTLTYDDKHSEAATSTTEIGENNQDDDETDRRVEFQINPNISNDDDFELILLYLQNKKRSFGGDIEDYNLNENKNILLVTYKEFEAKKRVLIKSTHSIKDYTISASKPFEESNFPLNKAILILRNMPISDDNTFVTLYAENLVPESDIDSIYMSKIFENTYYITYKSEVDFEKAIQRSKRRQELQKRNIEILEAFESNAIIAMLKTKGELTREMIDLHFTNKKRCGVDSYVSIKEWRPYIIIQFSNKEQVKEVLKRKHELCNQELYVENYLNRQLLGHIEQHKKHNHNHQQVKYKQQQQQQEQEPKQQETVKPVVKPKEFAFKLNKNTHKLLVIMLNRCDIFNASFQEYLKDNDYTIETIERDEDKMNNEFLIKSTNETASEKDLFELIQSFVDSESNKVECIEIDTDNLRVNELQQTCEKINGVSEEVYLVIDNDSLLLYGYPSRFDKVKRIVKKDIEAIGKAKLMEEIKQVEKEAEEKVVDDEPPKIQPVESEVKTETKTEDENNDEYVNLSETIKIKKPMEEEEGKLAEFMLTSNEDNRVKVITSPGLPYFSQFLGSLLIINSICEKNANNNKLKFKSIKPVINEVEWRRVLIDFITGFFNRFKVVEVDINENVNLDSLANQELYIEKLNQFKIEVIGKSEQVDSVVEKIKRMYVKPTPTPTPSPVTVTKPKVIEKSDLKGLQLYECRMLYAIKYKAEVESKYQNLKVKIETKNYCIKYEGYHDEIEEAKQKAMELFQKIRGIEFICEPIQRELMIKYEPELVAWLRTNNFVCVIDFTDGRKDVFHIYGMNKEDIQRCYDKLSEYIMTRKYRLDDALKQKFLHFLQLEEARKKWAGENKLSYIHTMDAKLFTICGFKDTISEVLKRIDETIQN